MKKAFIFILQLSLTIGAAWSQDFDLSKAFSEATTSPSAVPSPQAPQQAISEQAAPAHNYKWLVMVFLTGTNDLGILGYAAKDINEMEKVGSTDKVAVVVEYNVLGQDGGGNLQFQRGSKTLFVTKDNDLNNMTSQAIDTSNYQDMGSWKHLSVFARKNIMRFHPEKVMLIVWNHGSGRLGIAYDDVSKNHMEVNQLGQALQQITAATGKKIDIFATDACLMQMAAVDYQLKDYADVIVGSEESIPGPGYPYDDLINILNSTDDSEGAASSIVDAYYSAYQNNKAGGYGIGNKTHTLSAVRASKVGEFAALLSDWAGSAMSAPADFSKITDQTYTENAFYFGSSGTDEAGLRSVDLSDYLSTVKDQIQGAGLKTKTQNLMDFIKDQLVIRNKAGNGNNKQGLSYASHANGIAIYFPLLRYNAANYERLSLTRDTMWDDFLRQMLAMRAN